jgi:hypothetical protein
VNIARGAAAGVSLAGIFCVSFWVMWDDRKSDEPAASNRQVRRLGIENSSMMDSSTETNSTTVAPQTSLPPRAPDPVRPSPALTSTVDSSADELPVELHFRNRPDKGKIQGSVFNHSDDELVIDASILSPRAGETATVQLSIAAHRAKPFGLTDELDLQSGDQITLRSAPYRDKVIVIP